jgi:hypothetical protein
MLTSTCHCRAVRLVVPRRPRQLTNCNCSICRRYGTLWAYYKASTVQVICKAGATESYTWGDKRLKFVRCKSCGVVMQWLPVRRTDDSRMGVNARNFEPTDIESVRIRRLDGASTWKYLD